MQLNYHHLRNVAQTKIAGERSLESSLLTVHQGDQQVFDGNGQYRYLHRPLPQTSEEQPLHVLHPTIDSGSVFLSEKPMGSEWHYTREDIPNVAHDVEDVKKYRKKSTAYHTRDIEIEDHAKHLHKKYRKHPIYDQPHVAGDSLDGIHHHNHPDHFYYIDGIVNSRDSVKDISTKQKYKGLDNTVDRYHNPIHHDSVVETDRSVLIEGYDNVSMKDSGKRGYAQPEQYATVGTDYGYTVVPKLKFKVPSNLPHKEYYQNSSLYSKSLDLKHLEFIIVISLIGLIVLLGFGLALYEFIKRKQVPKPTVYAHIHPQFIKHE